MKLRTHATIEELAHLLENVEIIGESSMMITRIVDDSREAASDTLFVAVPSLREEKLSQILLDAYRRGARLFLTERFTADEARWNDATFLIVPQVRSAMARIAAWGSGYPQQALCCVGITGTNGKTTTSMMLEAILHEQHLSTARIGTLGAVIGGREIPLLYTTPPPLVLWPLLEQARTERVSHVIMEVSSHALALQRVEGLPFTIAIFTNLTRDHLDFHGDESAYRAAKRLLFVDAKHRIFNLDDPTGTLFWKEFGGTTYAIDHEADIQAREIEIASQSSSFSLTGQRFTIALPGRFNILNALAAIAAARIIGVPDTISARALQHFVGAPGRMERFSGPQCTVYVDYAHTPDALARALEAIRTTMPSRITVVFGCGGDRDHGKRPLMGEIAERLADRCIITSDNPRSESAERIAKDIMAGMQRSVDVMLDRAVAIRTAIETAETGEVILIAGKGAEQEQIIGEKRLPFDDRLEVQQSLKRRNALVEGERTP